MNKICLMLLAASIGLLGAAGCSGGEQVAAPVKALAKPTVKTLPSGKKLVSGGRLQVIEGDPNAPHGIPTTPGAKAQGGG